MSSKRANAKLTVLVSAATKRALEAEAKAKTVPVSEVVRQRLSGDPDHYERAFVEGFVDIAKRAPPSPPYTYIRC